MNQRLRITAFGRAWWAYGMLDLQRDQVSDLGLAAFRGYEAKLEELHLDGTDISDAGLAQLRRFSKLKVLTLHGTQVTDSGLAHLRELKSLEFLCVIRNERYRQHRNARNSRKALPRLKISG